jgi:two-component system response regulator RegA
MGDNCFTRFGPVPSGPPLSWTKGGGKLPQTKQMTDLSATIAALPDKSLLVLDDDAPLRTRLGRALEQRGFDVRMVESVQEAVASVKANPPAFAVLDLRLGDGTGLQVVEAIQAARPDAKVVMLTGYGNIATAVQAVKAGAIDYLAKPADADDVARALLNTKEAGIGAPPENPMSADRVRWEHIQRVYEQCGNNVSETARRLNMHRRTLQRILSKRAPK